MVNFPAFIIVEPGRWRKIPGMSTIPWSKIFSFTPQDITKVLLTAVIILIVNKVQVFSDKLSALLIALPLTSLLAMIWMYNARQPSEKIAGHAEGTFWFVLPTLPMFLVFPWMLRNGWTFWPALVANCVLTTFLFWATVVVLRKFGIDLMPK